MTEQYIKQVKAASTEVFPISFGMHGEDFKAFQRAVNQGIDSHLEAVMFTQDTDSRGRARFNISADTLHVLVRRLLTANYCGVDSEGHDTDSCEDCQLDHASVMLGDCICEVLGVEVI